MGGEGGGVRVGRGWGEGGVRHTLHDRVKMDDVMCILHDVVHTLHDVICILYDITNIVFYMISHVHVYSIATRSSQAITLPLYGLE